MPRLGVIGLMNDNAGVFGLNALHVLEDETWVRRLVAAFGQVEDFDLRPHVDRVFEAEQVADAHTYLQTKQARGKILLAW
jgi:NADPH:quinone reductase-like Zn-dependent oxidoreductase